MAFSQKIIKSQSSSSMICCQKQMKLVVVWCADKESTNWVWIILSLSEWECHRQRISKLREIELFEEPLSASCRWERCKWMFIDMWHTWTTEISKENSTTCYRFTSDALANVPDNTARLFPLSICGDKRKLPFINRSWFLLWITFPKTIIHNPFEYINPINHPENSSLKLFQFNLVAISSESFKTCEWQRTFLKELLEDGKWGVIGEKHNFLIPVFLCPDRDSSDFVSEEVTRYSFVLNQHGQFVGDLALKQILPTVFSTSRHLI